MLSARQKSPMTLILTWYDTMLVSFFPFSRKIHRIPLGHSMAEKETQAVLLLKKTSECFCFDRRFVGCDVVSVPINFNFFNVNCEIVF